MTQDHGSERRRSVGTRCRTTTSAARFYVWLRGESAKTVSTTAADPKLKVDSSLGLLLQIFREAPEPALDTLVGVHEGSFAGPAFVRLPAPLFMVLTGMPGWFGKEFDPPGSDPAQLSGRNLVRRRGAVHPSIPMQAQVAPSRVDGRLALVLSYPSDARWPWRRTTDELRPLDDQTLLGVGFVDAPLIRGLPLPFLLRRLG